MARKLDGQMKVGQTAVIRAWTGLEYSIESRLQFLRLSNSTVPCPLTNAQTTAQLISGNCNLVVTRTFRDSKFPVA